MHVYLCSTVPYHITLLSVFLYLCRQLSMSGHQAFFGYALVFLYFHQNYVLVLLGVVVLLLGLKSIFCAITFLFLFDIGVIVQHLIDIPFLIFFFH